MLTYLDRLGAWIAKRFGAPINTSAALLLAVYTVVWGFWLVSPWWTVFNTGTLYSWLATVAPEYVWGTIAIVCGSVMFHGIIRHTYNSLTRGAFIGFIHWGMIMTGYFIGDWHNTGGITAGMIMVYCGFIYLNLMVNRVHPNPPDDIL